MSALLLRTPPVRLTDQVQVYRRFAFESRCSYRTVGPQSPFLPEWTDLVLSRFPTCISKNRCPRQ